MKVVVNMCDKCQNHPATIHVERVSGGVKSSYKLCGYCADIERQDIDADTSFDDLIKEFLGSIIGSISSLNGLTFLSTGGHVREAVSSCGACGLSIEELREEGKFGCSTCYEAFRPQIEQLLQSVHGAGEHTGKAPKKAPREMLLRREIETMRRDLRNAVECEMYETAAELRDRIRAAEAELSVEG